MEYCSDFYFTYVMLLLYMFFDVNYFLRIIVAIAWGRLFEPRKKVDEATEIYGLCTTNDLDVLGKHMNNARHIRELNFARLHFCDRTGLYKIITGTKSEMLQTATAIRYRRTIPLFSIYKIRTRMMYWDEKATFLEQQFITLKDGIVRAVILNRQTIIGLNVAEVMAKLLSRDPSNRPTPPPELQDWLSSMEKSSARLKNKQ